MVTPGNLLRVEKFGVLSDGYIVMTPNPGPVCEENAYFGKLPGGTLVFVISVIRSPFPEAFVLAGSTMGWVELRRLVKL